MIEVHGHWHYKVVVKFKLIISKIKTQIWANFSFLKAEADH